MEGINNKTSDVMGDNTSNLMDETDASSEGISMLWLCGILCVVGALAFVRPFWGG